MSDDTCFHGWRGSVPKNGLSIADRCPTCGVSSIFVGEGGSLTCGNLGCKQPGIGAAVQLLLGRIAELEAEREGILEARDILYDTIEDEDFQPHYDVGDFLTGPALLENLTRAYDALLKGMGTHKPANDGDFATMIKDMGPGRIAELEKETEAERALDDAERNGHGCRTQDVGPDDPDSRIDRLEKRVEILVGMVEDARTQRSKLRAQVEVYRPLANEETQARANRAAQNVQPEKLAHVTAATSEVSPPTSDEDREESRCYICGQVKSKLGGTCGTR